MRLKNVKNLDNRQETMVENAYYQCKPPEKSAKSKSKENKDPMQLYTKYGFIYHISLFMRSLFPADILFIPNSTKIPPKSYLNNFENYRGTLWRFIYT